MMDMYKPGRFVCGVKIDVEGAEEEVVLGGARTLGQFRPLLFLEIHAPELRARQSSAERVFDALIALGYNGFLPLTEDTPPSCGPDGGVRGSGTYEGQQWQS